MSLRSVFFGESMFHRARDASKAALVHLVARLRAGGYRLLDTQFLTEHLASLGAIGVTRDEFRLMLAELLEDWSTFVRFRPGGPCWESRLWSCPWHGSCESKGQVTACPSREEQGAA